MADNHVHCEKSLKEKYETLQERENGIPQEEVAQQCGIPKSILSTWKKNKMKIVESYRYGLGV